MAIKSSSAIAATIAAIVIGGAALVGGVQVVRAYWGAPAARQVKLPLPSGPTIKGVVRGPDGALVSGAEIFVGTNRKQDYAYPGPRTRGEAASDSGGAFVVAKPDGPHVLVVRSPAGYAEISSNQLAAGAAGGDIKLQPWGKIEGILKVGDKPIPKASINLWRVGENDAAVHHETSVKTDANGHFVFAQVAPGECNIYYRLPNFRSAQWRYVIVEPGKTSQVQIGGTGRVVTGRIDVPPELQPIIKWTNEGRYTYEAEVRLDLPNNQGLKHEKDEAPEEYWSKEIAFGKTPEGKLYKEWRFGSSFLVNPDGTYRVEDLPAGKYTMSVRCFETDDEVHFMEDIARVEKKFEVPTETAVKDQPPIDVGTAVPTVLPRVRPGTMAADFAVKTIDGKDWKLSDHRDKPVVLVFWGAYGHDDRMTSFTDFARKWAKDPRVYLLGCYTAPSAAEAKKYIAEYKLDFEHAPAEELMNKFDNSWPSALVIGIDGTILQKHLEGETLEKYVNKSLGIATTAPAKTRRR
jgi:peroxiredoxin